eukprot:scaffold198988_cov32-Tisochrysis_lutea.AAC.1
MERRALRSAGVRVPLPHTSKKSNAWSTRCSLKFTGFGARPACPSACAGPAIALGFLHSPLDPRAGMGMLAPRNATGSARPSEGVA